MAKCFDTSGFDLSLLEDLETAESALSYVRAKCGGDVAEILRESFENYERRCQIEAVGIQYQRNS